MSLVNAIDLVREADAKSTAVLSFVCIDYNEARAVVNAAERTGKPAIVMLLPEYVTNYSLNGFGEFAAMVKFMAEHTDARIGLHLDHSYDEEEVRWAIECGFTSVMFDASRDDLETNIRRTRAVVEYAHARGVAVESELGSVGLASERWGERTDLFTKPDAVALFCRETGVDSLAIAIGTSHGAYKFKPGTKPQLRFDILAEVEKRLPGFPIVLHGSSSVPQKFVDLINKYGGQMPDAIGVPEEMLREAARMAVCKINIDTDLRMAMTASIRQHFAEHPDHFDPRQYLKPAREAIKEMVKHKIIDVLGCDGKAE
ncbi:MAG: ketose-bisphosphate aldolase [Firmicutes bacterium]|nr:ketose-bisphosphate aldolase [Bacillota bacterium]